MFKPAPIHRFAVLLLSLFMIGTCFAQFSGEVNIHGEVQYLVNDEPVVLDGVNVRLIYRDFSRQADSGSQVRMLERQTQKGRFIFEQKIPRGQIQVYAIDHQRGLVSDVFNLKIGGRLPSPYLRLQLGRNRPLAVKVTEVDGKTPIAGAEIGDKFSRLPLGISDQNGVALISVAAEKTIIHVKHPNYRLSAPPEVQVNDVGVTPIQVALEPAGVVSCHFHDLEGKPVARLAVHLELVGISKKSATNKNGVVYFDEIPLDKPFVVRVQPKRRPDAITTGPAWFTQGRLSLETRTRTWRVTLDEEGRAVD